MPTIASTVNPIVGQTLGFVISGTVPAGATFSEPVISQTSGPAGTISQQASVLGTAAADGSNTFNTAVQFATGSSGTGAVDLACDVGTTEDLDITFTVLPAPLPETITGAGGFAIVPTTTQPAG